MKHAYVFPGQGSQAVGMGKDIYDNVPEAKELFESNPHLDIVHVDLPFDSYSPLTAGTRGNGIGGLKLMSDNHYYGCCACIGAAGLGLVPKMALLKTEKGFAMNLYIDGNMETEKMPVRNSPSPTCQSIAG